MKFYIIRTGAGVISIALGKKDLAADDMVLAEINFDKPNGAGDMAFAIMLLDLGAAEGKEDWLRDNHQMAAGAALALVLQAFNAGVTWSREHPNHSIK